MKHALTIAFAPRTPRRLVLLLSLCALLSVADLSAQESGSKKENEQQPLQLPEIIIRGRESLSIRGGRKAAPRSIPRLQQRELDQLNSLEKLAPPLMPPAALPMLSTEQSPWKGFLQGSLGMYLTADVLAGLSAQLDGYSLYARGGLQLSNGHVDDAGYSRIHAGLRSDYVAPQKFWIFGGSRTVANLNIERQDYNLYALDSAEARGVTLVDFDVDTHGSSGGMDFNLGFGMDVLSLGGARDADHFGLDGYLRLRRSGDGFQLGGLADINIQSLNSNSLSLMTLALTGDLRDSALTLTSELGFDVGSDTRGESTFAPRLRAGGELELSESLSLRGELKSGLQRRDFHGLWRENPYVDADADVAFEYVVAGVDLNMIYHPHPRLALLFGIGAEVLNDAGAFEPTSTATFTTVFRDGTRLSGKAEVLWHLSEKTSLSGKLDMLATSLDGENGGIPYAAPLMLQTELAHVFGESVQVGVKALFVGERQADLADSSRVDAFFDLGLHSRIIVQPNFSIDVSFSNLLGQNIYIWRDYKEREIFARAGVSWLF